MQVNMVDFLPVAVVYGDLVVVRDAEFDRYFLGRFAQKRHDLRRSFLEIRVFFFVDNQQMDRFSGAMVGNHDDIIGLVEYLGRDFALDDSCKH